MNAMVRRVMNLSLLLTQQARRNPEAAALAWEERIWSWRELELRVSALAGAFSARGLRAGDRILVQSKNCNQLLESLYACFRLGAIWVPLNWRLAPPEVAHIAQLCQPAAVILQAPFSLHLEAAREACPEIRLTVGIESDQFDADYEALVAEYSGHIFPAADVNYDSPCWFFCTSGTTGRPKAAVLTHGQLAFVVNNHLADLMPALSGQDASLVVAPLSHGAGVHQLVQCARGVMTVLSSPERLDPAEIWALVARWRISNLFAVPTIVKLLVEHESVDYNDHSSLRYLVYAGAPMYREDQKRALRKLGSVLVQYFGLGEVTGNITVLPPDMHQVEDAPGARVGTCGYERTGMQVGIFDSNGTELSANAIGEICVAGPAVFAGYYRDEESTAKAFRNGWFRTGDLGYVDPQGFLFITGRASDMYISGGSNIYPREIEEELLRHPAVAEAAAFGIPDATWGETGVALVVLHPGATCTPSELLTHLGECVARYKIPKQLEIRSALTKSAYGKVSKNTLRQEFLNQASKMVELSSDAVGKLAD